MMSGVPDIERNILCKFFLIYLIEKFKEIIFYINYSEFTKTTTAHNEVILHGKF